MCSPQVHFGCADIHQPDSILCKGSSFKHETQKARATSKGLNLSIGMGGKWQVDWRYSKHHIVDSDARVTRALLGYPLMISVYCATSKSPKRSSAIGKENIEVIGHAEIDLSPLLLKQASSNNSGPER